VDRARNDGLTPLMIAAAQGHLEIVSSLLENGAAVNKANESGCSALYFASSTGQLAAVEALLACGAYVDTETQVDQHWHNFGCDMCGVFPIVGPKYRSSIKDNYDLCKRCARKSEAQAAGPFSVRSGPFDLVHQVMNNQQRCLDNKDEGVNECP